MKISVTRSGGFAGMTRHAEVDTAGRADADAWHALVGRADLGAEGPPAGRPDRYVYRISVDGRTAHVGEADLDDPTRELIDRVFESGS
ncbi:MAG TPA: protealysin inhibitor emfourin [Streptosporangiaceae bacterium]|jgi:hypothetical protein